MTFIKLSISMIGWFSVLIEVYDLFSKWDKFRLMKEKKNSVCQMVETHQAET